MKVPRIAPNGGAGCIMFLPRIFLTSPAMGGLGQKCRAHEPQGSRNQRSGTANSRRQTRIRKTGLNRRKQSKQSSFSVAVSCSKTPISIHPCPPQAPTTTCGALCPETPRSPIAFRGSADLQSACRSRWPPKPIQNRRSATSPQPERSQKRKGVPTHYEFSIRAALGETSPQKKTKITRKNSAIVAFAGRRTRFDPADETKTREVRRV